MRVRTYTNSKKESIPVVRFLFMVNKKNVVKGTHKKRIKSFLQIVKTKNTTSW